MLSMQYMDHIGKVADGIDGHGKMTTPLGTIFWCSNFVFLISFIEVHSIIEASYNIDNSSWLFSYLHVKQLMVSRHEEESNKITNLETEENM